MVNASKASPQAPTYCRIRPGDEPFWVGIMESRALDEWNAADRVVAVQLARCQHDIEDAQTELDEEGTVITNDRGTKVMNPRVTVLEGLARREMALIRTLRMGGAAAGDSRDLVGKRKIERTSRKIRQDLQDEDEHGLLA